MVAAKPEARARAIALRRQGWSYRDIQRELGVSMSSLSLWIRHVPLSDEQRAELARRSLRGSAAGAAAMRRKRQQKQAAIEAGAAAEIGQLTDRELFLVGVALYWAEGSKAKPWSPSHGVSLINSDATVILLFLAWLRLLGVEDDRLTFRLSIHESADVARATAFWAAAIGVSEDRFMRASLKRHNPRTIRRNTGAAYVGCLVIGVRRSTDLNRRIAGWWAGILPGSGVVVDTIEALSAVV